MLVLDSRLFAEIRGQLPLLIPNVGHLALVQPHFSRLHAFSLHLAAMDVTNPRLLYLKGALFVLGGLLAGGLIVVEHPELRTAVLLVIAIWCFARAYYFAFYVVEHYIDPGYRFAGLGDFARYVLTRRRRQSK
jgi:hypothetical protein